MREAHPLTSDELRKFVNAAGEMSSGYRLVGHILPFSGLHASEFQHLTRDWIHTANPIKNPISEAEKLQIRVPSQSNCVGTLKFAESNKFRLGNSIDRRDEPCIECEERGRWDSRFETRTRTIPVVKEEAVNTIKWWFSEYDSNPCSLTIARRVKKIARKAGLDRDSHLTSHALRDSFGVILLRNGFDIEYVSYILGYARDIRLKPLLKYTERSVDWESGGFIPDSLLIEELQRLSNSLHRAPKMREMGSRGKYTPQTYIQRFGGWNASLKSAGLAPRYKPKSPLSEQELLDDLQRLYDELGDPPTQSEIRNNGKHSTTTYYRRFGSVADALRAAGIDPSERDQYKYSEKELLDDLHRLADELGHPPIQKEVNEFGDYSSTTYTRRFGGLQKARTIAGIEE